VGKLNELRGRFADPLKTIESVNLCDSLEILVGDSSMLSNGETGSLVPAHKMRDFKNSVQRF